MAFNLPDGCNISDIPGFRPIDAQYDRAEDMLDDMSVIEKIELFEEMFAEEFLVDCFNEALMDDDNYDDETWFETWTEGNDEQNEKFVEYILSFKRDDVLTYLVERY